MSDGRWTDRDLEGFANLRAFFDDAHEDTGRPIPASPFDAETTEEIVANWATQPPRRLRPPGPPDELDA